MVKTTNGRSVRIIAIGFIKRIIRFLSRPHRPLLPPQQSSVEVILKACDRACTEKEVFRKKYLSMEMLSREVGTNLAYLKKALSTRGGFTTYINGYRLEYATFLIVSDRYNDLKIGEIAELSGFASERSMNYYVVKLYGFPVREFRRRVAASAQVKNFSTSFIASGRANTATRS